jgi:hypothetical protein
MTLDEFAATTRRTISEMGFEEYLPTACYPCRRHVQTLVGLPAHMDPEEPVLEWALEGVQNDEEFLVCFKVAKDRFKIIRRIGPYSENETYTVT